MSGAEPRASCRGVFKKLEMLPVPCQYILSLMLFIIHNSNNFQACSEIQDVKIKVFKTELHIPVLKYTTVCPTVF
jgi:hypothetical protein